MPEIGEHRDTSTMDGQRSRVLVLVDKIDGGVLAQQSQALVRHGNVYKGGQVQGRAAVKSQFVVDDLISFHSSAAIFWQLVLGELGDTVSAASVVGSSALVRSLYERKVGVVCCSL
jgi:predicted phosphoribosyltransferase